MKTLIHPVLATFAEEVEYNKSRFDLPVRVIEPYGIDRCRVVIHEKLNHRQEVMVQYSFECGSVEEAKQRLAS